ncbi:MAG: cytochrome b/b6 domain-containing protein [Candidatus Latescibacterota bacterium]|nr:MAG: cytochrome b/b6 domain-containing protein [Candidatus Latescibacterota bacterium]
MTQRVYMYSLYERIWHWLQAAIILSLFVTGLEVHAPDLFRLTGFEAAVGIHRILGFVLIAHAFLGLFYHLTTGKISEYFSASPDAVTLAIQQIAFYTRGIFRGDPHPFEKRLGQKLNPLQKITYVMILNVLLPVQIATGLLMWGTQQWPDTVGRLGGLAVLGAVHTTGSWLFAAFIIMHIYLTTTGHTPLANIRAMITGWEDLPTAGANTARARASDRVKGGGTHG